MFEERDKPAPGISMKDPADESTLTFEEYIFHDRSRRCGRVLSCFQFERQGEVVTRGQDIISAGSLEDVEILAITGTIYNKEGLFAQCGWFGGNDLDWFWVRIKKIRSIKVCSDIRFRRGEKCVWLGTDFGDYAMLLPSETFRDVWEDMLVALSPEGLSAKFHMMVPRGVRPGWWDDQWKDDWPFEKNVGSKRRASTDVEQYEASQRASGIVTQNEWSRIGAKGQQQHVGSIRTNLHFRTDWELRPDGGMVASHHLDDSSCASQSDKGQADMAGRRGRRGNRGRGWQKGRRGRGGHRGK